MLKLYIHAGERPFWPMYLIIKKLKTPEKQIPKILTDEAIKIYKYMNIIR